MADTEICIADLREQGLRLGIHCASCVRFRYLKLDRYGDGEIVSEIGRTLTCSRCLSKEVEARAVRRDAATGYWPAEYA